MTEEHERVLAELATLVREVIGEAWAEDVPITLETSFGADLELESIEFVALAERLTARYGSQVDFAGWLADKELGDIIGLRVGQVVEFIVACLASKPAA
jgi:acyl carrier protein